MQTVIDGLDRDEWQIIRRFEHRNAEELPVDVAAVARLLTMRVLTHASSTGRSKTWEDGEVHPIFPLMLSPLAEAVLRQRGFGR